MAEIIKVAAHNPPETLDRIAAVVEQGGVLVFPTDTIYGIGGNAFNESVIDKIYRLKRRKAFKPLSLHLGSKEEVYKYCHSLTKVQRRWLARLLPGPYTIVLKASPAASRAAVSKEGKVGLRVPDSCSFRAINGKIRTPLVGTSVNIAGEPPLTDIEAIIERFSRQVDLIITTDEPMTNKNSAVIDLTRDPPVALRGELPPVPKGL